MNQSNERPSFAVTATNETKNHECNCKQFVGLRKDVTELIILMDKIHNEIVKNNGGHL